MSVSWDRGVDLQEVVDLHEAKMSFPRLVSRQTATIPPGERTGDDGSISAKIKYLVGVLGLFLTDGLCEKVIC